MTKPFAAPVSRRTILKGAALGGVATFIAACTGTKASPAPSAGTSAAPGASEATASEGPKVATGPLMFANWPAYIDLAGDAGEAGEYQPGSSPTLIDFQTEYGVEVDYQEKIGDNSSFVETIKPALVAGLPTGWDLMVLTDWMASKIVTSGWAEKIDQANVPNAVANVADSLKGVSVGSEHGLPLPVAVGHDRRRLQRGDARRERDRGADEDRGPVEHPGRQGHLPDRGARHVRPRVAQARDRPPTRRR